MAPRAVDITYKLSLRSRAYISAFVRAALNSHLRRFVAEERVHLAALTALYVLEKCMLDAITEYKCCTYVQYLNTTSEIILISKMLTLKIFFFHN